MTTREFYTAIVNAENLPAKLTEKAAELLSAMDKSNEKRRGTETKEKKEAADRVDSVRNFFQTNPHEVCTRDAIAAQLNITPGQVTAACKVLLARGVITKSEAKIDKTKRVVYSLAE